jgi:hypothetical protein
VLEGALDVQAAALGAPQHADRHEVHGHARERHHEHGGALDVGWLHEAPDALVEDHRGERQERGAVQLRGQDLGAFEAERVAARRRPAGEARGRQRECDRTGVGEHVGGVREKGERGGEDAGHDLYGHESEDQRQRDDEPAALGGWGHVYVAVVHTRDGDT